MIQVFKYQHCANLEFGDGFEGVLVVLDSHGARQRLLGHPKLTGAESNVRLENLLDRGQLCSGSCTGKE